MKTNWCKILGHRWVPVYIIGFIKEKETKLIGTECKRCGFGEKDLLDAIEKMDAKICSYSKKYYK